MCVREREMEREKQLRSDEEKMETRGDAGRDRNNKKKRSVLSVRSSQLWNRERRTAAGTKE